MPLWKFGFSVVGYNLEFVVGRKNVETIVVPVLVLAELEKCSWFSTCQWCPLSCKSSVKYSGYQNEDL